MAKSPKVGSQGREASHKSDPTYAKNTILDLAKRAETGNQQAVENLMGWLTRFPDMRHLVRGLDALATKAEQVWMNRLAGNDLVARIGLQEEVSKMKAELLGPKPTITDQLLVASVIVSYLAFQQASLSLTQRNDQYQVLTAKEKVLVIAQNRLHDAIRNWELHSKKKHSSTISPPQLKLFDSETG